MIVKSCEFVISAMSKEQFPRDFLPEIALAGRSNVGKSSLINRMINRKNLARTSSQPGKTQTLNYYLVNNSFYFVDFPGYGFAKVSKSLRQKWGQLIESYLLNRSELKLVLQIVDLRHPPTADDRMMYEWLKHYQIPMCVVATKADKIPKTRLPGHLRLIRQTFGMSDHDRLVMFSAETGAGKDELWSLIASFLQTDLQTESPQRSQGEKP
ncbi:MAG TPA: ribosome biogenesis GTP-binding protein YihA/YsxC [Bacilli bacterium]